MNQILEWLSGGDLRSDGLSDQVAEFVLVNPELISDLAEGLNEADDVIRGRATDALEKVARTRPDLVRPHLDKLAILAATDPVPMVKMHVAMILGHLAIFPDSRDPITSALLDLMEDQSVFARSWAIVGLCILARLYPEEDERVMARIAQVQAHGSPAIRTRVRKALQLLSDPSVPFPKGWIKSNIVKARTRPA